MKYAINGKFLSQFTTGVQRYAREILLELDKIVDKEKVCIVYANDAKDIPKFNNIQLIKLGKTPNFIWLQYSFPKYCKMHNLISVNLCGAGPLIDPGIVVMHDIGFVHYPSFVSKKFYYWGKLQIINSIKRSKGLITVSNFSKNDIETVFPITKDRLYVIGNAWQHMTRVKEDDTIFQKKKNIRQGEYYFTLSSLTPNKNLKWIIDTAKISKSEKFVVAGNINEKVFGKMNVELPENVFLIGYISDEESKALMHNCKGFIFPTFFEGFGIPPMEALASGAKKIIISDTDCMHEIYNESAYYINPREATRDINDIVREDVKESSEVLDKYSWEKSAKKLKRYLKL